jgi:tetratricopeptide (TPR) repeat protein
MRTPTLTPTPTLMRTAIATALALAAAAAPAPALAAPAKAKPNIYTPKADRKDLPTGVADAAKEAFARGRELDEAGDLWKALAKYREAREISPHPSTTYNIADVYRRLKKIHEAIDEYTLYLKQAPDAPDRAAVEQLIESLRAVPGQLTIHAKDNAKTSDEQAFVDGEPAGMLPLTLDLREGWHEVDVITPISYAWMNCQVQLDRPNECTPSPAPREDGNVVMSGPRRLQGNKWRENGAFFMTRERFELRHGHYTLEKVTYKQCKPVEIDIPRGEDVVTFVYFSLPDEQPRERDECDPVTVHERTIKLAP